MTKKEYLHQLEEEIILLDEDIADDIIEYYRLRFEEGKRFEGKTVQEIIDELGTPKELAKRIYSSYDIREDIWESARDEKVVAKKAIPVIVFDVLVASWLIPLLVFITLAGFAAFVTFPFVIAAIPGLVIRDALLVILLAIGTYSILLLLVLGLTEVGIVVIKNILIWNIKVLSPKNKTTSRMIKRFSLFQWMRQVKMGRNIFINLGMVAITIISIAFILLSNFNSDVFGIFNSQPVINEQFERELTSEIEAEDPYTVYVSVGDADVQIIEDLSSFVKVDRNYNLEDGFTFVVDTENNQIRVTTDSDVISEGLINSYASTIHISIPEGLTVESVVVVTNEGDIDIIGYEVDDMNITTTDGKIHLYDIDTDGMSLTSETGNVTLISSFVKDLIVSSQESHISINDINNMLKDGSNIRVSTYKGSVNLENTYFEAINVDTNQANVYITNENDIYIVPELEVSSSEGEVIINVPFRE